MGGVFSRVVTFLSSMWPWASDVAIDLLLVEVFSFSANRRMASFMVSFLLEILKHSFRLFMV